MAQRKTARRKSPKPKPAAPAPAGKPKAQRGRAANGKSPSPLPIVGLGASAGGLEALRKFFRSTGPSPGVAFIVIQHLDPTRGSETPALLGSQTSLPVVMARDGMPIQANRVYTNKPGYELTVSGGRIRLRQLPPARGLRLPIDALFNSMGEEAAECAIAVVLSGTGSDGSAGLAAIKAGGGLTIAQTPDSAEYDGMPRSAIATGSVDVVLPVETMMRTIGKFVAHDYVSQNGGSQKVVGPDSMSAILSLLHNRRRVDFSGYKRGTLTRRIHRRMGLRQILHPNDYLELLRDDPNEVEALFSDVLIQVTRFFREPEAWAALEKLVLAPLVKTAGRDTGIRAWVPGCATGEEAYSLGMLLIELREKAQKIFPIQIFASDLDDRALEIGRTGQYLENALVDISPGRVRRFFDESGNGFRVKQELRDMVVFARHNVLTDPPFGRMDLISCRNLLIYFESPLQQRVMDLFSFALKPGRFLWLGSSETIGSHADRFVPVSKKDRIYRRMATVAAIPVELAPSNRPGQESTPAPISVTSREDPALVYARNHVLAHCTAATVLINRRQEIQSLFGPVRDFLSQPSGALTADLYAWLPEGSRAKIRPALQLAIRNDQKIEVGGLQLRGSADRLVTCTVEPVQGPYKDNGLFLVGFSEEIPEPLPPPSRRGRKPRVSEVVRRLKKELKLAQDELQASVEQLESSNEELKATNEETLSINEELQSTNEELQTSKEELQSVNEELNIVNSQLELKMQEVELVNDDLGNLLASIDTPILFLDRDLRIRRFTDAATRAFRLIASDVGRPLGDITSIVRDPSVLEDALEVLTRLTPVEKEVKAENAGYNRRILPYRAGSNRIDGVVIVYSDITDRMRTQVEAEDARDFAEGILESLREPLLVLDTDLKIVSANSTFFADFKLESGRVLGRRLFDAGDGEWNIPELRSWLEAVSHQHEMEPLEVRQDFADIGSRTLVLRARLLADSRPERIVFFIEDATRRAEAEEGRNLQLREMVSWEEKERHRLALELHDETGQHLTAFLLGLGALKTSQTEPAAAAVIEKLQALADELARRLHGLSLQLRPTALDEHGLERALESFVEDLGHRYSQLEVDYQVTGGFQSRLPPLLETVIYRVAQESLSNILKHASATKVSLVLDRTRDGVRLAVEDNGIGFDQVEVANDPDHLGLRGMEERVNLAGGFFWVESRPGGGTTIFARIPLQRGGGG